MTDVVVTDAHNTVVVGSATKETVVIINTEPRIITTGLMGPPGAASLTNSQDIDISNLSNGSLLIYNSSIQKWVATNTLDGQVIDCGQF